MKKELRRLLPMAFVLFLCMAVMPSAVLADESYVEDSQGVTEQQDTATLEAQDTPSVIYQAHVQDIGWQNWVEDGQMAGTEGQSLRMEGVNIILDGASGSIHYQAHVQDIGWMDPVADGDLAGTQGMSLRVEAFKIWLEGSIAERYDVVYHVHVQDIGWMDWVANGEMAGTEGLSLRMEALEIKLIQKDEPLPANAPSAAPVVSDASGSSLAVGVNYQTHVQDVGWQDWVSNGQMAGTSGQSLRLEGMRVQTEGIDGGVVYRTHVQDIGWQDWAADGEMAGTEGQSLRLEAMQLELTGNAADAYDIYYRTHVQNFGWMGWAKNGEMSGSSGFGYRLEGLEIQLVEKGGDAPYDDSDSDHAYILPSDLVPSTSPSDVAPSTRPTDDRRMDGVDISGWNKGINIYGVDADFFIIKATEGVQGTIYNPWYSQWADEALDSGRHIGFYHYANGGDAIAEADCFYDAIKDYKGVAIACLDWEGQGNSLFDTGMDVAWCKKFLDRLKARFGGTPFIYTSKNFTTKYDWSSVAQDYPLWGAQYPDYNDVNGYLTSPWQSNASWGAWGTLPTIFQYTSQGKLVNNGGNEYFDFDLFYGNESDWEYYAI